MDNQIKEMIVSKGQLSFYKQCYAKFGYEVQNEYRNKYHLYYTLILCRTGKDLTPEQYEQLRRMEEKLRIVEIINQKKRRFLSLFINLFVHVSLFCLQGMLFSWLRLRQTHPEVMLRVGVVILQLVLIFGLGIKIHEWIKWNVTLKKLKKEALDMPDSIIEATDNEKFYVSVLFTRGTGLTAKLIYWLTGRQYTHASIGPGKQTDNFYSFDFRGFRIEHPAHRRLKNGRKNSLCYQFFITQEEYDNLKNTIDGYIKNKEKYHYNFIGIVFCFFHIYLPFKDNKTYFCSEFVSAQLLKMKSFNLKMSSNMYFPNKLAKSLSQQDNLYHVMVNEV